MRRITELFSGLLAVIISIGINNTVSATKEVTCLATGNITMLPANLEPNTVYMRVECTDVTQLSSFEVNKNVRDQIFDGKLTYGYWYDRMNYLIDNDPQWQKLFQ